VTSELFFFLNQQFITQSARANRGSYFVTTLHRKGTTGKYGKRKREGNRKREKLLNKQRDCSTM